MFNFVSMQITEENKSIIFTESGGRVYSILKEDIKLVLLGADSVAVYDSQSRQQDARRLVIDYADVTVPNGLNSGKLLFDYLKAAQVRKTTEEVDITLIQENTSELIKIKELLKSIDNTLQKIYSPE